MDENQLLPLIKKYLSGQITALEEKRLFDWYNYVNEQPEYWDEDKIAVRNRLFASIEQVLEGGKIKDFKKINLHKWLRVACAVLVFLTCSLLYFNHGDHKSPSIPEDQWISRTNVQRVTNKSTESRIVKLSDGSLAVLRPNAQLIYPERFGPLREVYLSGEAFFEVKKDAKQPFIVHTERITTQVIGTSFTVISKNIFETKVIVTTGKVSVKNKLSPQHLKSVLLTPNMQTVYSSSSQSFKSDTLLHPLMLSPVMAKRMFTFNKTPLPIVIERLKEAYDINININEEKYRNRTISGNMASLMFDQKLNFITEAINAKSDIANGRISIN